MTHTLIPLISIIVPVYNVEEYLSYCIESILRQTYQNLEILLMDDGSTDSSLQLCKEFESKDDRCKVFHHENHGVAYTRNRGLQLAKGEYISFIDSDDYIDETFIETLYTHLIQGNYDFAMVDYQPTYCHDFKEMSHSKKTIEMSQKQIFNCLYNRVPREFGDLDDTMFMVVWNKLYKKCILTGLLFPPYVLSEDIYFNNLVFLSAQKAILIREKLYYYFQRTSSASHVIDRKYIQGLQSYFASLKQIPEVNKEYRAACLIKLYKNLLNTRYLMKDIPDKKDIDAIIKNIKKQTVTEMIHSKFVPVPMKIFFVSCYEIPILYSLFMRLCELRAKV